MAKVCDETLVIIPTYNELENLPLIVGRVRKATPEVQVLIVDDNSPDGTGEKADELARDDDSIHVLHREGKGGLLGAYRAGFDWGLERDYNVLCQMDADGSHAPEQLHLLLEAIEEGGDLVIGSRYVDGGKVVNWPKDRYILSKGGNLYISLALSGDVKDMTAGYRAIRREVLETLDLDELSKKGYIFQVELAFRAIQAGFDVREVPITFTERELGESKLDASFAKDSLAEVTKWGLEHRGAQLAEIANYTKDFALYELKRSPLASLPRKTKNLFRDAVGLTAELGKLADYEVRHSPLAKVPGTVKDTAETATGLVDEGTKLLKHDIDYAKRKNS
ncbi:polyprenol monophosphomannose synthase [Corynebacterium pilosum]|uniref:dolichyl-phosphate beta-D-mannosyltransferase n=1 Tax=Corynebacterium pilosum TaxID=35756 RepID=A0A376CPR7_9CORY|nr:prenol monophospho-mannose synthase [Corynebacterium pilosum]